MFSRTSSRRRLLPQVLFLLYLLITCSCSLHLFYAKLHYFLEQNCLYYHQFCTKIFFWSIHLILLRAVKTFILPHFCANSERFVTILCNVSVALPRQFTAFNQPRKGRKTFLACEIKRSYIYYRKAKKLRHDNLF